VTIEGEIRTREYTQKATSKKSADVKRTITEIRIQRIAKLERAKKDGESLPDARGAAA
jgi:single-stranded DNA-binding protein